MKRFLIPAGSNINLDHNGFLPDPENKWNYNEKIVSFEKIENEPCLIILGEPGIGKTTLFKNEAKRLSKNNKKVLWVNFKDIDNSATLKEEISEHAEIRNINEASEPIYLFLDGLDESIITFDKLSSRLTKELEKLPKEKIFIRISGRTVNFPNSLINELEKLWNTKDKCFEICPLRWLDVENYAKSLGISDTDKLFETIRNLNLAGFTNKPITLKTIIELYKEERLTADSTSQFNIYFELCKNLAKENNPYRNEQAKAGHQIYEGNLLPEERLYIAGRIAVYLIFNNKISVFDGIDGYNSELSINIDDLCSGYELIDGKTINIAKENIREVLGTSLFSLIKRNSLGFSHKSYAEFLAAWYINQKNIDFDSLISLITFPDSQCKVVPQLYEVASWLASFNNEIFEKLSESDPDVLITSSVNDFHNKEKLVKKLFELISKKKLSVYLMEKVYKLSKLNYEGLEKVIENYLKPKNKEDNSIKFLAIAITRFCKLKSLEKEIYAVAKNPVEDYEIRGIAFATLTNIASPELKKQIASDSDELISDFKSNDKDDNLKGAFLHILWPDYISAKGMFSLLNKPKNDSLHGSYKTFIYNKIVENLDNNSIIEALDWISSINESTWDIPFVFQELMKNIYEKAFIDFSNNEIVLNKFGNTIYQRFKKDYWHLENFDRNILNNNDAKRQNLIKEIIFNILVEEKDFESFARSNNIIQLKDISWLVDFYKREKDLEKQAKIGKILNYFGKNWEIDEDNQELKQIFDNFNSDKEISNKFGMFNITYSKKKEEEKEEKPHPQLFTFINQDLTAIEEGKYLVWENLTTNIKLGEKSELGLYAGDIANYESFPGWKYSDEDTKKRIINAAKQFIEKDKKDYSFLINSTSGWSYCDYLGYDALNLLYYEGENYVENLSNDLLEQWAPVIITWAFPSDDLIKLLYERVPDRVISILSAKIDFQSFQDNPYLTILDKFNNYWDKKLTDLLINKLSEFVKILKDAENKENIHIKPEIINIIFDYLINYDLEKSKNLLNQLFEIYKSKKYIENVLIKASLSFIEKAKDAGWDIIWNNIKENNDFGKKLVYETGFYRHINSNNHFPANLKINELTNLFIWLEQNFPSKEDPAWDNNSSGVTNRHEIGQLRWQIFNILVNNGKIKALEEIISENPNGIANEEWFSHRFDECRKNYYKINWKPNSLNNIIELINNPEKHLVNDAEALFKLVLKTLAKIQTKFHGETAAVSRLWNTSPSIKPKEENEFSDEIKICLEEELVNKKIIINREPEIKKGDETDIKIDAINESSKITIIIESKGCWHDNLKTAIEDQLRNRYLNTTSCDYGIYLVGWFFCDKWYEDDYRKSRTSSKFKSIDEISAYFNEKDKELSQGNKIIKTFIFDATLR